MVNEDRELVALVKIMNENMILMNKLIAVNIGKNDILKEGVEMGDKIKILDVYDIPDKYIAILLGTTPGSIASTRLTKKKAEKQKETKTVVPSV